MIRRVMIIVFSLILAAPCLAADREFNSVVSAIQTNYNVRRTHIPMIGFANFCLRISRSGVSGLKLAVFKNPLRSNGTDGVFEQSVESSLEHDWHQLVRVHSRKNDEITLIYASGPQKRMKLLVIAIESGEATVLQMKINPSQLKKWLDDPKGMAHAEEGG